MCTKQVQEPQGARCGSAVAVVTEGQNRQRGQGRPWPASVGHLAVKCGLTQVRAFGAWQHGHKHFSSSMLTPGQGCIPDQRRGSARPQRGNGLHPRDTHFDRRRTWTKSARRPRSCGAKATSSSDQEPSLHGIVTGHAPDKIIEHGGLRRSVCGGVATRSSVLVWVPCPRFHPSPWHPDLRQSLRCQRISRNRPGQVAWARIWITQAREAGAGDALAAVTGPAGGLSDGRPGMGHGSPRQLGQEAA